MKKPENDENDYGDYGDDDYGDDYGDERNENAFNDALAGAKNDFGFDVEAFGNNEQGAELGSNDFNLEEERLIGHIVTAGKAMQTTKRDHLANLIR